MVRRSHLVIFYFKEKFCVWNASASHLQDLRVFISKAFRKPCRKKNISGYNFIWHKLFIQTVKCSFFKKITVYLSFYGWIFWSVLLQNSSQCVVSSSFTFQRELSRSAVKFHSNLLRLQWHIVVAQTIGLEKYRWKMGSNEISLIIVEYYRLNCCRSRSRSRSRKFPLHFLVYWSMNQLNFPNDLDLPPLNLKSVIHLCHIPWCFCDTFGRLNVKDQSCYLLP